VEEVWRLTPNRTAEVPARQRSFLDGMDDDVAI
jgi:hypothetical protein